MTTTISEKEVIQIEEFNTFIVDLMTFKDLMIVDKEEILKRIENPSQKGKIHHIYLECISFTEELIEVNIDHFQFFKTFLNDLNKIKLDSEYCESIFSDQNKVISSNELPILQNQYKELEAKLIPMVESLFYSTLSIFSKNKEIDFAYEIKSYNPLVVIENLNDYLKKSGVIVKDIFENMEFFNTNYSLFLVLKRDFEEIKKQIVTAAKS
jgi:hypothetical protein